MSTQRGHDSTRLPAVAAVAAVAGGRGLHFNAVPGTIARAANSAPGAASRAAVGEVAAVQAADSTSRHPLEAHHGEVVGAASAVPCRVRGG